MTFKPVNCKKHPPVLPLRSIPSESSISIDVRNYGRPVVIIRIPNYVANELLDALVWITDDEIEAIVAWWMLNKDRPEKVHQRDFWHEAHRKNLLLPSLIEPSAVLRASASRNQSLCSGTDCHQESSTSDSVSERREEDVAHRTRQVHRTEPNGPVHFEDKSRADTQPELNRSLLDQKASQSRTASTSDRED